MGCRCATTASASRGLKAAQLRVATCHCQQLGRRTEGTGTWIWSCLVEDGLSAQAGDGLVDVQQVGGLGAQGVVPLQPQELVRLAALYLRITRREVRSGQVGTVGITFFTIRSGESSMLIREPSFSALLDILLPPSEGIKWR